MTSPETVRRLLQWWGMGATTAPQHLNQCVHQNSSSALSEAPKCQQLMVCGCNFGALLKSSHGRFTVRVLALTSLCNDPPRAWNLPCVSRLHSCWHIPHTMIVFGLRDGSAKSKCSQSRLRICGNDAFKLNCIPTVHCARILRAARVGFNSGTMMYHVCVVAVVLVATTVDLLQSSSQSLFCGGFANCVGSVGDVARLGICQENISSNRRCKKKQVGIKTHMPAFFAPSCRFAFRTC